MRVVNEEEVGVGQVIAVDFGRSEEIPVSKRELAARLRRSRRWVELRVSEGMPSWVDGNRRMFRLSEVRTWLEENDFKAGATGSPPGRKINGDKPDPDDTGEGGNRGAAAFLAPTIA